MMTTTRVAEIGLHRNVYAGITRRSNTSTGCAYALQGTQWVFVGNATFIQSLSDQPELLAYVDVVSDSGHHGEEASAMITPLFALFPLHSHDFSTMCFGCFHGIYCYHISFLLLYFVVAEIFVLKMNS